MSYTVTSTADSAPVPTRLALLESLVRPIVSLVPRSIYLLAGFPLGVASFVVLVTGLAVGIGTIITFLGLPILVGALLAARLFATIERGMLRGLLGRDVPPIVYHRSPADERPIRRLTRPLTDAQSWRDVLHGLLTFPVSVAGFVITVTWWTVALGGTTWYAWGWILPQEAHDLPELLGFGDQYLVRSAFYGAIGLAALFTLPLAIGVTAAARSYLADLLLVSSARDRREIDDLVEGRAAGRAAEDSALRRLERDIHDGPQQRLVRLSMDLGRAEQKVVGEAPELAEALGQAKRQAQETLDELRALSRGIAPPVLADRGLASAIEELAARSSVPTGCRVELEQPRLPAHVETAAYFLVAEALTNVAKHSRASMVAVVVDQEGDSLIVEVTDDGVGGAHPSKGHGLAGLEQRIRAVDGRLHVSSPDGGPTTIRAEIPCNS